VIEKSHKSLDIVKHIWKHEGVLGFYKGYGAGLLTMVPYSAIFFTVYETVKDSLSSYQQQSLVLNHLAAGTAAGFLSRYQPLARQQ
jgi:hypothetical protein